MIIYSRDPKFEPINIYLDYDEYFNIDNLHQLMTLCTLIKFRIHEIEPYVLKSYECAWYYTFHVLEDRWLDAETVILNACKNNIYQGEYRPGIIALLYAVTVMKSRWLEAEQYFNKFDEYNFYSRRIYDNCIPHYRKYK